MELSKMFQNNTFPINFTFPNYTCFNFRSHFVEWRSINAVLFLTKFHFWNWTKFWIRPGPQNNVMRESKNWHTKWQRKMHDNDRSPYWLSPLLKVRSRVCWVYVWENTLRYDVLRVNRTALNHYGDCSGQNVSLSKIFVAANSWIGLEVVF